MKIPKNSAFCARNISGLSVAVQPAVCESVWRVMLLPGLLNLLLLRALIVYRHIT